MLREEKDFDYIPDEYATYFHVKKVYIYSNICEELAYSKEEVY